MKIAIFNGLNPVLPFFILLIGALLAIAVAYYSYHSLEKAGPFKKWSLILLRFSSLMILLLLLLNPYLTFEGTETNRSSIAVYLDNSQSITVEKGDYSGLTDYEELIEEFRRTKDERVDYVEHTFGSRVLTESEVNGSDSETRLNEVVLHLLENEYLFDAAILFSDGINTTGRNPLFAATELSIPVITVPVGDTSAVRDLAVSEVNFSSPVFTNTVNRITADIQHQQVENEQTEARLIENGELVESKQISFQSASGSQLVEFSREYEEPGFYNLMVEVVPLDDEFTNDNNRTSFNMEVLDDKTRILSLAFEIHPDIAAIRNHIATDIQNELTHSNWLGGNRFSGLNILEMDNDDENYDLIVLHGLPPSNTEIADRVEELVSESPVLLFTLPNSSATEALQAIRPYSTERTESLLELRPVRLSEEISHSLLELNIPAERSLPPLKSYSGSYNLSLAAETLLGGNFQGSRTDIPILVTDESRSRRIAAVNAFGWYRYKINREEQVQAFFEDLISNLVSWTSTSPDDRNLILTPAKSRFTENEDVEIRAVLTNERGEPETNGIIRLQLKQVEQTDDSLSYRMNHTGSGNYSVNTGQLPEGIYQIEGEAEVGGRSVGSAETRVIVGRSNLELVNTRRDDSLLSGLAENSGGIFLNDHDFSNLYSFLNDQNLLQAEESITTDNAYIKDFELIWFLVVLGLLTTEWLIRRSLSLV